VVELIGKPPRGTRASRIGIWAAGIGVALVALSAGHKLGFLASPFTAMGLYAAGSLALVVALVSAALGLLRSGGSAGRSPAGLTWAALLVSLALSGNNAMQMRGFGAPPIHDISTDTDNPPVFVAVLPLRAGAQNPPQYAGTEFAEKQKKAYPDLQPITVDAPPEQVYARAKDAATALGWQIVAAVPGEGRIEATDTTRWFGFKDDVVIRIVPQGDGTRVDVRSKSRVGKGDAGVNARRIRAFRDRLLGAR
jgi:uncharacterized protein (DUF1499 family)